ncbi:hypothetical protein K0T92_02105 [Paenibacillus oenotherae]|uniref:Uncharacterized protein n=1 Tax=Paenibacillus oenotherae TaxID=1435645 RepID=A0ABS7D103_9BACL|nr:hypothetical protein [Paenibacillus oenotherae]MBW7473536.1 hypothetical protein [Paenibacillus oenotherae]
MVREDGRYYYFACEDCGDEVRVMRAYCIKSDAEIEIKRNTNCSCGTTLEKVHYLEPEVRNDMDDEPVRCPKCRTAQVTVGNKGFGLGKAALGGILLGPVGLLGGVIGSKKVVITCLKCAHKWDAGDLQH